MRKPTLYPRTQRFWTYETGPDYGFVAADLAASPDVLLTSVGSFITKGPGLSLPSALKVSDAPSGPAYYIVQFTPAAIETNGFGQALATLVAQGATLIDYVPNNGYIVKLDPSSYSAVAGSRSLQYIGPYQPAYKIARDMGTAPLADPDAAASPIYSIVVTGFRGTIGADLAAQVTALGGKVRIADDTENGGIVFADLHKDKIIPLARVEGVRTISENLPRFKMGEESSWNVIAGTYIIGSKPPLYLAGVNGNGKFKLDVDVAPLGAGDPRTAGPEDTDWNGNGVIDNGAQVIADTDTGMAVDAGDFAETAFASGWTGAGGNAGPNVHRKTDGTPQAANHRKIAWYEVAPGGFGTGDLLSCDPGGSHGTVTSGQACGNASSGPFTADGLDWSGDGVADNYGDPNTSDLCGPGFCFTSGTTTYRVDGVAPGARLVFQDVNSGCPEASSFTFGSYNTLLTDSRAKGARLHTFSFGAFNTATGTQYDSAASAIDAFLTTDANRDYMMFIAAGNNGSATANTTPSGKANTLSNEASAKNALVIGANTSGNAAAQQNRSGFSSIGPAPNGFACSPQGGPAAPAPSNCGRIKPDLMAPGQDGNTGLAESYNCVSGDGDQVGTIECLNLGGNSGTSFSTPNAAGGGALARDYFAQGLYPDGTSGNASNDSDRVRRMSGALVKALLIASASDMNGGGLTNPLTSDPGYVHRFNPEYGYGFINLRKVLPLTTDPLTPSGLIVHDAGCPTGVTCASNLSLASPTIGAGASSSSTFDVLDRRQELRVALAWIEPVDGGSTGALVNNLDLELRYCGADGNCATNGGDVVYYGNVFTEDRNDDGTSDQDLDGTPTYGGNPPITMPAQGVTGHWRAEGAWSLANRGDPPAFTVEASRDVQNNNEAVYLSPDPEGDGTDASHDSDSQLKTGKWQVTVKNNGASAQKYAVVIAGGVTVDSSIRLDTNPISCNGDVAVIVNEVAKAPSVDPGCNTGGCTEATIEGRTTIKVTSSGGAQVDFETASAAKARFNLTKDPNSLSFVSGKIPVSTAGAVNNNDDILVAGDGYIVTASYADTNCDADGTAGCFGSRCQTAPATSCTCPALSTSCTDATGCGAAPTTVCISPETVVKSSQSTFDCTPNVDFFAIGQPGRNSVFLLAGGCDDDKFLDNQEVFTYLIQFANLEDTLTLDDIVVTMRAVTPDNDNEADPGRLNNAASPYVTVQSGAALIDKVFPGFLESAGFTVAVSGVPAWDAPPAAPPEVEMVVGISSIKSGKSAPTYGVFSHLLNADEEKFLYSTDYPLGATVDRDLNSNEKIENPVHDRNNPFPLGNQRNNFDGLNETITFSDMQSTAFGGGNPGFNGPWDFDTNDEGFRSGLYSGSKGNTAEITNWGEDQDYDGSLSGTLFCQSSPSTLCTCPGTCIGGGGGACVSGGSSTPCGPGGVGRCYPTNSAGCNAAACGGGRCLFSEDFDSDQDGTLDEGWGLGGGCGYLSSNGPANRGVWHTGQIGPVGAATCSSNNFGPGIACENMDTVPGTAATNLWLEFLRTPVIQKVHKNADARNLSYRVEISDWRWNVNSDYQPDLVGFNWEFDENTASLDPVDLGDGLILAQHDDGMGPINGANPNLTSGFPMFVENDPDDDTAGFGQKGTPAQNGSNGRNRTSDRSCLFANLTAAQTSITSKPLREPGPPDDDCDNDIVSYGADGCPGYCNQDDDGDGVTDNIEEACPCYTKQDGLDDDADGRTDEPDERQRFYRCTGNTALFCSVTGVNTDDCVAQGTTGPCARVGNGKPKPYGDDVCGDGSVDESTSAVWARETALGENGHRISQNQSWNLGSVNGPFLRFQTLEDTYDAEAGNSFQGAVGFIVFEGTTGNVPQNTYGLAIDDMTVEWQESHPIEQTATAGCGNKTCNAGPRAGKLCFNNDDCGGANVCGGGASTGSSCAAVTWGTTNLFAGSGVVSLNVVDFNADQTQGTFDCSLYGLPGISNDCDGDGLKEIQVQVKTAAEVAPELIRLEQTSAGSSSYTGLVSISSAINAANDGVAFIQYNGTLTPQVSALYFDKDSGAGDANGDGTPDGPPSVGKDGCPGFCGVDDDKDAVGPDKRVGAANVNDDGNGICDYKSSNVGAQCTVNSNCPGGNCLNIDEADELCGRVCTAGSTSGHCSATSTNSGAVCTTPGAAGTCVGGTGCIADNCISNADCGSGGNCPGVCIINGVAGAACTSSSTCAGGYCAGSARGDDNCLLIDEPNELCAVVAGKLASNIDDNCGCDENPITANLNAVFDVADVIIQDYTFVDTPPNGTGDNDGFADDNELISVNLTLRNLSSFDVEGVEARLTTQDATIQCINDPAAKYGRINALQSVGNGSDLLKFTVANVGRTALTDIKQATFTVTITGTAIMDDGSKVPFEGTATPQKFTVDLDLDVNGAAPAAAKTTRSFQFENLAGAGNYTSDAAWNADWVHSFFETQSGLHCQYNNPGNPAARSAPAGCFLRQDVGTAVSDDWHLHSTVHAGGVPDGGRDSGAPGSCSGGGNPGAACNSPGDCTGKCANGATPGAACTGAPTDCRGKCSLPPNSFCSNSTECSVQGQGKCTAPAPGSCTSPAPGTCSGIGNASMHVGVHAGAVDHDTVHLDNIFYAYYKPTIQIGLGRPGTDDRPILDFWQQMSETDDRIFSNVDPPYTAGACTIHVLVDRNSDGTQQVGPPTTAANDGWWEKIVPFYGVPTQQRRPFGNCSYDPNDDSNNENDIFESGSPTYQFATAGTIIGPSSTCYPEFIWGCAGDTQDPPYDPNLGQLEPSTACFAEVNAAGAPIVREGPGPGRWIETKFDLYRYRGRQLWVRYLVTDLQVGFDTWNTGFPPGGFGGNRDDGWYIDDLNYKGTNTDPQKFTLKADTDPPPASGCPASNCSTTTPRFSGSNFVTQNDGTDNDGDGTTDESDEGKFTTINSDAPLRNIDLNGADNCTPPGVGGGTCLGATTSDCLNGILQYRFWEDANGNSTLDAGELIRDYTENPRATANPLKSETIHMNVRCTAPAPNSCNGAADTTLVVTVGGRVGGLFSSLVFDKTNKNRLEWNPVNATAKYDVATKQSVSANTVADTAWLNPGGYFDTMVCGGATPGGGNAIACTDTDADGLCEFAISADGTPAAGTFDFWIIRETQGSWNEIGGTSLGATTRDTRMADDGTPVCSNATIAAP